MLKKTLILLLCLNSFTAFSQERSDYPELQVTPRASERLAIESKHELAKPYSFQLAITSSALVTLVAGISQTNDYDSTKSNAKNSATVGLAIGGGWLVANMLMAYQYRGYTSALSKIQGMAVTSSREQLIKERLAEEEINQLGRIGKTMKWASFTTNALAGVYMASKAKKDSAAQILDGAAVVASLLPIIFSNHYEDVAQEQRQYKKKIFGTISSNFLLQDPGTNKWVPGIGLAATF